MKDLLKKLHVETFLLDLKDYLSEAPNLIGYPARLLHHHTLEVQVEKSQGLNALFQQLAAAAGAGAEPAQQDQSPGGAVRLPGGKEPGQGGAMNTQYLNSEFAANLVALRTIVHREVRRFVRISAADPAAAGDHHGSVLRHLR